MGRYRYRPLHLFGGIGLLMGAVGFIVLLYLTVLWFWGQGIGAAAAAHAGRAPRRRRDPVRLARPALGAHHLAARGANRRARAHRAVWSKTFSASRPLRVLYFGTYERGYPRNSQVISCLRQAGVEVDEHHASVWDERRHKLSVGAGDLARIALAEARLAVSSAGSADIVMVGYPGHADMLAAKRVARGRPVVFNPLVSLEDTIVSDRGLAEPRSLRARALRAIDRNAFRGADLVVADTAAHARHFVERFGLGSESVAHCYVGADDDLFRPGPRPSDSFTVLFVGKLIPLHGLETILGAAALCPEIAFHVVGSGQLDDVLASRPANVRHDSWVQYEHLPELYRTAGCALGIFGTSGKTGRVIPNKAFQAMATATALVTADTAAARELLDDGRDALLVPPGDAGALALAIRRLASDPVLRAEIAARGRATYEAHAAEDVLGRRWRQLVEQLISRSSDRRPRDREVAQAAVLDPHEEPVDR